MKRDMRRREMKARMMLAISALIAISVVSCGGDKGTGDTSSALLLSLYNPPPELSVKGDGVYVSPDTKASLTVSGPARVLKLSGTSAEMGYNYGYLLAAEIMNILNRFSCWVAYDLRYDYDTLVARQDDVAWETATLAEMEAMLEGIRDALPEDDLTVRPAGTNGHTVSLDDLKILNTLADWACSSFSVWGGGRSDGSSLIARNLDYYIDPAACIKRSHVIVSYNPGSGTRWVNVAFCGIVGCISGMNEHGFSAIIQNTATLPITDKAGFVPRTIALRKVMEGMAGTSDPADAETMLEGFPNYNGCNYLMTFPAAGRADGDDIAAVMEYDGKGDHPDGRVTRRSPSDNTTLPWNSTCDQRVAYPYAIINTNHYLKRNTVMDYDNSIERYCIIKDMLPDALGDGNVTMEEARDIMDAVGGYGTLHTIIFEPDEKFLRIFLSSGDRGAFEYPAYDFQFEDLF